MWGKSLRTQTYLLENGEESYSGLGGYLWTTVVSSSDSTILWALREDYNPSIIIPAQLIFHQMGKSASKQQKHDIITALQA